MTTADPMSGLDTLDQIGRFLTTEVVGAVPAELAGEVRAAVKLLRTAATELNNRHVLVRAETDELLALIDEALVYLPSSLFVDECATLRARAATSDASLREMDQLLGAVYAVTTRVITALQRAPRSPGAARALDGLYAALGRHAESRLPWQAVFPVTPDCSATEGPIL